MTSDKKPEPEFEVWTPFPFTKFSECVRWIKSQLFSGDSISLEPVDTPNGRGYLTRCYVSKDWTIEEILEISGEGSELGLHERHGLSVFLIGADNPDMHLIEETLDAGFTVYLIAGGMADRHVTGSYILRAGISDNS